MDEFNNEKDYEKINPDDVSVVDEQPKTNGLAIASLVVGIISIIAGCCGTLGIIFGIVGAVLAIVSKSKEDGLSGLAIAGLVCSIIGLLIGIVSIILGLMMGTAVLRGSYDSILNSYNY